VNFSRINGSRGMALLKRSNGGQAIALWRGQRNGPSARWARWGPLEVVFRGPRNNLQRIHALPLFPRRPFGCVNVSESMAPGISPYSGATNGAMRTIVVVAVLALVTIAFGIYSEAVLMSGGASHAGPDPTTLAIAHGLKRG
jgi:hypothetical protein